MAFPDLFQTRPSPLLAALMLFSMGAGAPAVAGFDAIERESAFRQLTASPTFLDPIGMSAEDFITARCVVWGDMAIMLSPTMSLDDTRHFTDSLPPLVDRRYRTSRFWLKTATDGNVTVPGERITLTWSFVPDGTLIAEDFSGSTHHESRLFQTMTFWFLTEDAWQGRFRQSFDAIGDLIGVNYVEVSDDGAQQPAPGVAGVRGDIRISMIPIETTGVLAFNYLPDPASRLGTSQEGFGGDMVLNSNSMVFFSNAQGGHRRLRHVVMHEHGHGLGFLHVDPINFTKLMEAEVGAGLNAPQEDDIRGFQNVYGDWLEVNNSPGSATELGELPQPPDESPLVLNNLAIERAGALDYFRFNVPGPSILAVTAEPVGFPYQEGPQGGVVTTINSPAIHDLIVDVMAPNGLTVIATLNETGAGSAESGEIPLPPEAGDYFVRVRSGSASQQSQRYRLTLSRIPVPPDMTESMMVY